MKWLLAIAILTAALSATPTHAGPRLPTCTTEQAKTAVIREETIAPGVVRRTHVAGCYTVTRHTGAKPSQTAPKRSGK